MLAPIQIKQQLLLPSTFRSFADKAKNPSMSMMNFARSFTEVQKFYMKSSDRKEYFFTEAKKLIQDLIDTKKYDFAGIVTSNLCKLTEYIPEKLEFFAQKGYEIAKQNGDYIHMMARLNNLRKIYYRQYDKLIPYIQVLYKQEKCLKQLTKNYDIITEDYHSLLREPASKKEYQQMLAHIQVEIAKVTKRKHPYEALEKLNSAKQIFENLGNFQHRNYINRLISETEEIIYHKRS